MNSAHLKISRAKKHTAELSELLKEKCLFSYMLETNTRTGERATYAKENIEFVSQAAIIIGDVIHNLRASIDHAYWEATNEFAKSEGEKRNIQFPITSTEKAFNESVLPGLPCRVSGKFVTNLKSLRPWRDKGGNHYLCSIHDLDVTDKHKLLIPVGNYTKITSEIIQKEVPDFPDGLENCTIGSCRRDVGWRVPPLNRQQRRANKVPKSGVIEHEINVPVGVAFSTNDLNFEPVMDSIHKLIGVASATIECFKEGTEENS